MKKADSLGLENSVAQLKEAIQKVREENKEGKENTGENQRLVKQLNDLAQKEVRRTPGDIYNEVIYDEINDELLKSLQKTEGEIVMVLIRQERLKSFEKLWINANMDFY